MQWRMIETHQILTAQEEEEEEEEEESVPVSLATRPVRG